MSGPAIIIADKMHPDIIFELENLGYRVDYHPDIDRASLKEKLKEYNGLIIRSKTPVDHDLIADAGKLQFVARAGAGVDNLNLEVLQDHDIQVINAPEGNRDALAEHAMGMLLALMNQLPAADQSVRRSEWKREQFRGIELGGKVVGLIGYGNMGQAFAKRLTSFNCKILAYDKYKRGFGDHQIIETSLEDLFTECDILSLHVPLTAETRNFYDFQFFKQFNKSLILINTARGEILPLGDLKRSMAAGTITAAALDVFEGEPISYLDDYQEDVKNFLVTSPNLLLSPHIAGWSVESYQRINKILVNKIAELRNNGLID